MADEFRKQQIKRDLKQDISYYDEEIAKQAEYMDDKHDRVELEKLQREQQKREIDLKNID